jgi:hypothetical protein
MTTDTDTPPTLYHYTCADHAPTIDAELLLRPNEHPLLPGIPLVWLTDLDTPVRDALGLTRGTLITCDRTTHRFTVADPSACIPWVALARLLPRHVRDAFEAPPAMPMHWWVSASPIPVLARTGVPA